MDNTRGVLIEVLNKTELNGGQASVRVTYTNPPTTSLSTNTLSFSVPEGGANPALQPVVITNSGTGDLNWSAASDVPWLNMDPPLGSLSPGLSQPISVQPDIAGLSAGTYTGTIRVEGVGATNGVQTVSVTLTVNGPPTIGLSETSLSFTATEGGVNPPQQSVTVTNTGGQTLNWSASDDAGWLSVSATSGNLSEGASEPMDVVVDIMGLAAGNYTGTITITGSGATNSPQAVSVTLTVNPPNEAPTVSAGSDQTITLPSTVTLSGTVADDSLPNPPGEVTITWSKVSGPGTVSFTVSFGDASAVDTSASFSTDGTYVLRITADDGTLTASDDVTVTVNPEPAAPTLSVGEIAMALKQKGKSEWAEATVSIVDGLGAPVSEATVTGSWGGSTSGSQSVVTDSGGQALFVSSKVRGTGSYFTWTVTNVSGSGYTYDSSRNVETSDSVGDVPVNQAPVVSAGGDQSVTLPNNTVLLNGSATDDGLPSGTLATSWSQVSGPGTVTFVDASILDTTASFPVDGTYVLRLMTDDGELSSSDDMTVTVNPEGTVLAMHVGDIAMSAKVKGPNVSAKAVVTIVNASGAAVSGVTVTGSWSGATVRSETLLTDGNGQVNFGSGNVRGGGTFTFTVTGVVLGGYSYDAASNVETSDTITQTR